MAQASVLSDWLYGPLLKRLAVRAATKLSGLAPYGALLAALGVGGALVLLLVISVLARTAFCARQCITGPISLVLAVNGSQVAGSGSQFALACQCILRQAPGGSSPDNTGIPSNRGSLANAKAAQPRLRIMFTRSIGGCLIIVGGLVD